MLDLAYGQDEREPPSELFTRLKRMGLAEEGLSAEDPLVVARLVDTGADHAWMVPRHPRAARLLDLLRRVNSRRKVTFQLYGQTTCLPETGVARCLELTARIGARKRVLLVGDDDMLSPVLVALGHKVTVLEIDPRLVDMLSRVASEDRLSIRFLCQDVRDPVPADLVGKVDAVLTDPMTFAPCLLAFLSRACSAVKVGGTVMCALHASGGAVMGQVLQQLPLERVDHLKGFNSYHDEGFQESWYHSDMVVLRRTRGAAPYPADARIPIAELIQGAHGSRWHGWRWVLGSPFKKTSTDGLVTALGAWRDHLGLGTEPVRVARHDRWDTLHLPLSDGGHVTASLDRRRNAVCFTLHPFITERDLLLLDAVNAVMPPAAQGLFRGEVTPLSA